MKLNELKASRSSFSSSLCYPLLLSKLSLISDISLLFSLPCFALSSVFSSILSPSKLHGKFLLRCSRLFLQTQILRHSNSHETHPTPTVRTIPSLSSKPPNPHGQSSSFPVPVSSPKPKPTLNPQNPSAILLPQFAHQQDPNPSEHHQPAGPISGRPRRSQVPPPSATPLADVRLFRASHRRHRRCASLPTPSSQIHISERCDHDPDASARIHPQRSTPLRLAAVSPDPVARAFRSPEPPVLQPSAHLRPPWTATAKLTDPRLLRRLFPNSSRRFHASISLRLTASRCFPGFRQPHPGHHRTSQPCMPFPKPLPPAPEFLDLKATLISEQH